MSEHLWHVWAEDYSNDLRDALNDLVKMFPLLRMEIDYRGAQ